VAFAAGDFIGTYTGRPARRDGTYVLWVLAPGKPPAARSGGNLLRWVNHDAPGNARFHGFNLYALRDIAPGEEITFDYTGGDGAG
jgi:SET domain-containing protein